MAKDSKGLRAKKIDFQISTALLFTFIYAVIMTIVLVGLIIQMIFFYGTKINIIVQ